MYRALWLLPVCWMLGVAQAHDDDSNDDIARIDHARSHTVPYPPAALERRQEGVGSVECDISAEGRATQCAPAGASDPVFVQPALLYASEAHYLPSLEDGVAKPSHRTIRVVFRLTPVQKRIDLPLFDHWHSHRLVYPKAAIDRDARGSIEAHCTIDVQGVPHDCVATGSDSDLDAAVLTYLNGARYYPAMQNEQPVSATYSAHFSFALANSTRDDGFGN
jgi:outer membrane biosynthesis protein TonB